MDNGPIEKNKYIIKIRDILESIYLKTTGLSEVYKFVPKMCMALIKCKMALVIRMLKIKK